MLALYASAVGFADALWLCPKRALRCLFASVSLLAPGALSPLLHCVFPDGFRHRCTVRLCGGASPLVLGPIGTLGGVAVAPPISPYTGPGWSPPFCRVPLVLRSVFSVYRALSTTWIVVPTPARIASSDRHSVAVALSSSL